MARQTAADRALKRSAARMEMRKDLAEAGSSAQVKIFRERGRQRRSVEKVKTQQRVIERQQSEAARTAAYKDRSQIAIQQQKILRDQRAGSNRNQAIVSGATKSVTSSTPWSTLMLVTTLFFVMILLYVVVTNGAKFGRLTGSVGTFIQGLSSNKPLFVKKTEAS